MEILRRPERAMVRVICGAKLMEKKRTRGQMAKANGVRWYGHVFRRDDRYVLRNALK